MLKINGAHFQKKYAKTLDMLTEQQQMLWELHFKAFSSNNKLLAMKYFKRIEQVSHWIDRLIKKAEIEQNNRINRRSR